MSTEKLIELRQELPSVYKLNGAVYIAKIDYLLKTKQFITEETIAYVMPDVRSWDIDKETDFIICALLKNAVPKI
jgi:N-acylneuraminate cytidylyltransferase